LGKDGKPLALCLFALDNTKVSKSSVLSMGNSLFSRALKKSFSESTLAMAKNDKKEKKDSDSDIFLPKEEGAIEIPEPIDENDSTIAMSGSDLEKAEALDPPEVEVEVDMFEEISEEVVENTISTDASDFSALDEIESTKQPEIKKTMLARDSDIEDALDDSGFNIPEFGSESSSSEVISIANGTDAEEEVQAPSPKKTQLASKQSKHTQFAPAGSDIEPDKEVDEEVPLLQMNTTLKNRLKKKLKALPLHLIRNRFKKPIKLLMRMISINTVIQT
jgi:hypothetical protein